MADIISIEHEDSPGVWDVHYSGAWTGFSWVADGPLFDGVTYKYRAERIIDGVSSGYGNESSVVYSAAPAPSGHGYYYHSLQED